MSPIDVRDDTVEWLEADGQGGFASGTASGKRTRRYHALLLAATTPPTGRFVLVSGFDAGVTTAAGAFPISSQVYAPGVIHPDGVSRIESFRADPWPVWTFRLPDGSAVEQEIFVRRGAPLTVVSWRLVAGPAEASLEVRPFLAQLRRVREIAIMADRKAAAVELGKQWLHVAQNGLASGRIAHVAGSRGAG